jgi:hypothetical protein
MRGRVPARCGLAALLAFLTWPSLAAELAAQPPGELRVARLIKRLGADSYADRSQAADALEKLGATARQQLTAAIVDPDPEIRLHAKDLLAQLNLRDLWAASEVAAPTGRVSASKLLAIVGEQTGNHLLLGDEYGTFHEHEMTVDAGKQPFWPLVDGICRASGNRVRPHLDPRRPGLVIVPGNCGKYPLAYAGPIRCQLTSARRNYSEELSYETLESDVSHVFQLGVQMVWEDRFRLVAFRSQPEVVSAVTPDGIKLPLATTAGGTWNVAGTGTRQVSTTLRLQPPPIAARELDSLVLRWGLIAAGDMATIEVTDLKSAEPHFQDDLELSVESVQSTGGGQYAVTLLMTRELTIPEPAEVIFQENEFELFDAEQKPFRKQGQTNTLSDEGAKMVANFIGDSADSVPKRLTFSYPRLRSQKEVELEFRHVPLPVGRPE